MNHGFHPISQNNANEEVNSAVEYEACRIKLVTAEHKLRFDQISTEVIGSNTIGMQICKKKQLKLLNFRSNLCNQFAVIQFHQFRWKTLDTDKQRKLQSAT